MYNSLRNKFGGLVGVHSSTLCWEDVHAIRIKVQDSIQSSSSCLFHFYEKSFTIAIKSLKLNNGEPKLFFRKVSIPKLNFDSALIPVQQTPVKPVNIAVNIDWPKIP